MTYLGEKAQIKVLFTLGASTSSSFHFVNCSPQKDSKAATRFAKLG